MKRKGTKTRKHIKKYKKQQQSNRKKAQNNKSLEFSQE